MTVDDAQEVGLPRPLRNLVLVVGVVGVAALVRAAFLVGSADRPPWWALALVVAGLLIGDLPLFHVRFGHDHHSFTWSEAVIVVCLGAIEGPWLILLGPLAAGLGHLFVRRSWLKAAFNCTANAIGLTLAVGVYDLVLGRQDDVLLTPRSLGALAAGAAAFFVWNGLSVSAAVAFSQRVPVFEVYRKGFLLSMAVWAGNTGAGVLFLATAAWDARILGVFPPFLGFLYLTYRAYLSAIEERDTWQILEESSRSLNSLDLPAVVAVAVDRVLALFRPEFVEVMVAARNSPGLARGTVWRRRASDSASSVRMETLDDPRSPWQQVFEDEALHFQRAGRGENDLDTLGLTMAIVLPMATTTMLGSLRIGFAGKVRMHRRELQILSTFANQVATAIENAQLFERTEAERTKLEYLALHDVLTDLGNRSYFLEKVTEAIGSRPADRCAVLLLDLDRFKDVNDTLGHRAGDSVLSKVAERLRAAARDGEVVARLGGDEFAVFVPSVHHPEVARQYARHILELVRRTVWVNGSPVAVDGSVGIALYPDHGSSADTLLQRADVALYLAKRARGTCEVYSFEEDSHSPARLALVAELRDAVQRGELIVHYQPKARVADGVIVGVEALARWQHPTRGMVPPAEFIPVAEDSGLIRTITRTVLAQALADVEQWRDAGVALTVAVNVSPRDLHDPAFPDEVIGMLTELGVSPSLLCLEVTETSVMWDPHRAIHTLGRLSAAGIMIAVDDFGAGHASLGYLKHLPVNQLKIDGSFVRSLTEDRGDEAIVRSVIGLGHSLGMEVVAEGVEDAGAWQRLAELGCDFAQGYVLSPPVERSAVAALTTSPFVPVVPVVPVPGAAAVTPTAPAPAG